MAVFESSPPHYRHSFAPLAGPVPRFNDELPAYSRRQRTTSITQQTASRDRTEHLYQLVTSKSKPWATLKVHSSAKSSKHLPTFYQGEPIEGSLALNLDKGDAIQSVCVLVTGQIITGSSQADAFTFFDHSVTLWSKATGQSRTPSPQSEEGGSGKLQGDFLWPFTIHIPKSVKIPDSTGEPKSYYLPQTFSETHTRASVLYELTVRITRGKLRTDSHLRTALAYVPSTKPGPSSILRQIAYQENRPLSGPEVDIDGWKTLHSAVTHGSIFNSRKVSVKVTLSLARPLCYTRGSVIPCVLDIECNDRQALDLLSTHSAAVVRLQRRVRYATGSPSSGKQEKLKEEVTEFQPAVWWPSETRSANPHVRQLNGEISLEKDLTPSSSIAHFSIAYSVVMQPFRAPAFTSLDNKSLLVEPVDIATAYARGPRPRPFCPPGYENTPPPTHDYRTGLHSFHNYRMHGH